MQCPRCGSNKQFSDNIVVGCDTCGYISGPVPSLALAKPVKELPANVQEMARHFDERLQIRHDADVRRNSECAF